MSAEGGGPEDGDTFSTLLLREFSFLSGLGFRVEELEPDSVTWTRGDRSLQVSRDGRDGFVDTHLADRRAGHAFGLRHALSAMGRDGVAPEHGWQAWEVETQQRYVGELARIVEEYLVAFLDAPRSQWAAANALLTDLAESHTRDIQSRQLRSRAEAARQSQDWQEVDIAYRLLVQHGFELTRTERARWHRARHVIGSD